MVFFKLQEELMSVYYISTIKIMVLCNIFQPVGIWMENIQKIFPLFDLAKDYCYNFLRYLNNFWDFPFHQIIVFALLPDIDLRLF